MRSYSSLVRRATTGQSNVVRTIRTLSSPQAGQLGLDEEHSGRVADLDGGDPQAVLVVHRVGQVPVQGPDPIVDLRDGLGFLPEPFVRPYHDTADGHGREDRPGSAR